MLLVCRPGVSMKILKNGVCVPVRKSPGVSMKVLKNGPKHQNHTTPHDITTLRVRVVPNVSYEFPRTCTTTPFPVRFTVCCLRQKYRARQALSSQDSCVDIEDDRARRAWFSSCTRREMAS
jgi:hypothetical protein